MKAHCFGMGKALRSKPGFHSHYLFSSQVHSSQALVSFFVFLFSGYVFISHVYYSYLGKENIRYIIVADSCPHQSP